MCVPAPPGVFLPVPQRSNWQRSLRAEPRWTPRRRQWQPRSV